MLNKIPINGEILFIGVATVINALFNGVVLAIFSYYYWDVVPEMVLGRFNSMVKIFTAMACLVWSFWVVGYAENHMKLVYIGVSVFCLSAYLLSVWRVKEGEYPPPAPRKNTNLLEPLYEYFSDCFSKPYYLWIFFGSLCFQLGNQGNNFAFFYFRYDLGMDLGTTGWISGMSQTATIIFGLLFGYSAGSMVDRLLPLRVIPVTYFIWTLLVFISFFVVHDKQSAVVMACCVNLLLFVFGVALSAATVKMFPREKIGQFCSAQACFTATGVMILNPLVISPFFDWIKYNRAAYLWSSVFYFLAGLISVKVYFNWKATQEPSPELEA